MGGPGAPWHAWRSRSAWYAGFCLLVIPGFTGKSGWNGHQTTMRPLHTSSRRPAAAIPRHVSCATHRASRIPPPARRSSQNGIALIIVMISVMVLTVLAAGFAYSMKVETKLARNANNEAELEWLGRSGVEYARWVLANSLLDPTQP